MKNLYFLIVLSVLSLNVLANNVQISNLTKSGSNISFDLSWENSWYVGYSYHDAVWIFFKQAPNGGPAWQHANVTSATVDSGFSVELPSDEVGFFVRRASTGNGTATTSVTATVTGLIGAFQDIKAFGVEMVFVPAGSFYAGDGASNGRIGRGDDIDEPVNITSSGALTCGATSSDIGYAAGSCFDLPTAYPKGFSSFYCMKYVITQQQYVDFLNCLGRTQQENRVNADVTGQTVTNVFVLADEVNPFRGNVVRCDETIGYGRINFYCDANNNGTPNEADDGLSRACNFIKVTDWSAYLDWSGLRPYTFLELEKASRGPLMPVAHEFSWGSSLYTNNGSLVNAGLDNEAWSNSGIEGGISTYSDDVIRVGANAPATGATRELSNASFYGIIDIANNPGEFYVDKEETNFIAEEGDGTLSNVGAANVTTWPAFDATLTNAAKLTLSTYGISNMQLGIIGASSGCGGRGVRSNF